MDRRPYSIKEIRDLIRFWPRYTAPQIAQKLNRTRNSVLYIARRIRKEGVNLPPRTASDPLTMRIKKALGDVGKH